MADNMTNENVDVTMNVKANTEDAEQSLQRLINLAKKAEWITRKDKDQQKKARAKEVVDYAAKARKEAGPDASEARIQELMNKKLLERYQTYLKTQKTTKKTQEDLDGINVALTNIDDKIKKITKSEKKVKKARIKQQEKEIKESAGLNILAKTATAQASAKLSEDSYKDLIAKASTYGEISKIKTEIQNEILRQGKKGADTTGLRSILSEQLDPKMDDLLKQRTERLKSFAQEWQSIMSGDTKKLSKQELAGIEAESLKSQLASVGKEMRELAIDGEQGSERFQKLGKEARELAKDLKKAEKAAKPTVWQKLFETFKRIGFYRLARDFFRLMINGFKEGISALTEFDDEARSTMEDWNGSMDIIKVSMSTILLSIIQMIAPAVRDIATAFAEVANHISQAVALMNGLGTYTKINTEYIKELGKQANLSFDKFEALDSSSSSYEGLLIPDQEIEDDNVLLEQTTNMLNEIKKTITSVSNIIRKIFSELDWEIIIGALEIIITRGLEIVNVLFSLIESLVETRLKVINLATSIGGILLGLGLATSNWTMAIGGGILLGVGTYSLIDGLSNGSLSFENPTINKVSEIIKSKGSLLSSPEMSNMYSSSTAGGDYLKESFTSALMEASDAGIFDNGDVILQVDGAEIARSKRLKGELNRTNPKIKLI